MQKPSLGRVVLATISPDFNNGADAAPAVITRVWSDTCVNVRVLADSAATPWVTSVPLFESREALDAHHKEHGTGDVPFGTYWPPRV